MSDSTKLHPRNKHQGSYDMAALIETYNDLKSHVFTNTYGTSTIKFSDPVAVKALNKALLMHHYGLEYWDIPEGYLCPPIPGRADYIHHVADLLGESNKGQVPTGAEVKCFDIGVGANCIYPILGHQIYGWSFVGVDIDEQAVDSAAKIVSSNPSLEGFIDLRLQQNGQIFFKGVVKESEQFNLSICNPPFHASAKEAQAATRRKVRNLSGKRTTEIQKNFGGQHKELWYKGGEIAFIQNMIKESISFAEQFNWFTTLVSKESNLPAIYKTLKKANADTVKTIHMGQGNKKSRIVAWRY